MIKTYSNGTRKCIDPPMLATGTDVCADLQPGYLPYQLGFLDAPLGIPCGSAIRLDPDDYLTTPVTTQRAVLRP